MERFTAQRPHRSRYHADRSRFGRQQLRDEPTATYSNANAYACANADTYSHACTQAKRLETFRLGYQ